MLETDRDPDHTGPFDKDVSARLNSSSHPMVRFKVLSGLRLGLSAKKMRICQPDSKGSTSTVKGDAQRGQPEIGWVLLGVLEGVFATLHSVQ